MTDSPKPVTTGWVRAWSSAPQSPGSSISPFEPFSDATLRQIVPLTSGGSHVRIRLSNEYGDVPIHLGAASVSTVGSGNTVQRLTFGGSAKTTIPPRSPLLSDPLEITETAALSLVINLYVVGEVESCTSHGLEAETRGWLIPGDATSTSDVPLDANSLPARALVTAVEILPRELHKSIVAIGDSLTDGAGATIGGEHGWPEQLARRIVTEQGRGSYISNQGISGNCLLNGGFGDSVVSRFDRDVLATPNLGSVIVLAGTNDILLSHIASSDLTEEELPLVITGGPVSAVEITAGYLQLIERAHQHDVSVIGATIPPFGGADAYSTSGEVVRQEVNAWIRRSDKFDTVVDFDAAWRDSNDPTRIQNELHSGDHLHGNNTGYAVLAEAFDLSSLS